MAEFGTYGIDFPFTDSVRGDYLRLTETPEEEIKANLIHLLLTRKGSRFYLPDFGTRLYEYIFEPLDSPTFDSIESEIRDQVDKYIPNLRIENVIIEGLTEESDSAPNEDVLGGVNESKLLRIPDRSTAEHTARVKIDFTITTDVFQTRDFVIINI